MNGSKGVSLVELLISLVIISITFVPLVMSQVTSLQISTRSALSSQVKAAATQELEQRTALVLQKDCDNSVPANLKDEVGPCSTSNNTPYPISYYFIDYFYSCPTALALPAATPPDNTRTGFHNPAVSCTNTSTSNLITTTWTVTRDTGLTGEGLITISVTSTHSRGPSITVVNRISCYDVYPSPLTDAKAPCPFPAGS